MKYLTMILITVIAMLTLISCECSTETETVTEYITDTLYVNNPEQGELIQLNLSGNPCMCEVEYGINGHTVQQTVFSNWMQDIYVEQGDSLYFWVKKPLTDSQVTMGIYRDGKIWKMKIMEGDDNNLWLRILID